MLRWRSQYIVIFDSLWASSVQPTCKSWITQQILIMPVAICLKTFGAQMNIFYNIKLNTLYVLIKWSYMSLESC
jgi:hypothetical protein